MTTTTAIRSAARTGEDAAGASPTTSARLRRLLSVRNASALYLFAILFVVFALWEPSTFLTLQTWQVLLDSQAIIGLVALGLIVSLSAGVIDLAVGSEAGFGGIVVAWLLARHGVPIPLAIVLSLVAGALVGVVIATLIVRARIMSLIVTLAASSILIAMIAWISGSQQILNLGASFQSIATDELFGLTYPVYVLAGVALLIWYFLERTALGRRIRATGGNVEAARLAGVRTSRMILVATVTCGVVTALAGILASSQLATGDPTISQSYLLPAFAAAFLGSTQFSGGRFNVAGTLVAVIVLAVGVKGLQLGGAPIWLPDLFNGIALVAAVGFAQFQKAPTARTAAVRRVLRLRAGDASAGA
jgi:ribose transport system permease protein